MTPNPKRQEFIEQIRSLPDKLEAMLHAQPPEKLALRSGDESWTVAQVLHHIADAHMNSFIRCKLILTEDYPTLKPFNQDLWAETADAREAGWQTSMDLIRGLHTRWAVFFDALPETAWERKGKHPESGDLTIAMLLEYYANHSQVHLDQLKNLLEG